MSISHEDIDRIVGETSTLRSTYEDIDNGGALNTTGYETDELSGTETLLKIVNIMQRLEDANVVCDDVAPAHFRDAITGQDRTCIRVVYDVNQ